MINFCFVVLPENNRKNMKLQLINTKSKYISSVKQTNTHRHSLTHNNVNSAWKSLMSNEVEGGGLRPIKTYHCEIRKCKTMNDLLFVDVSLN